MSVKRGRMNLHNMTHRQYWPWSFVQTAGGAVSWWLDWGRGTSNRRRVRVLLNEND